MICCGHEAPSTSKHHLFCAVLCLVYQLCLTLCNPIDCRPPDSFVHGDSPGKNTGVGCRALLQGIFPTRGSNPSLWQCRWILYHLSHQASLVLVSSKVKSHPQTTSSHLRHFLLKTPVKCKYLPKKGNSLATFHSSSDSHQYTSVARSQEH